MAITRVPPARRARGRARGPARSRARSRARRRSGARPRRPAPAAASAAARWAPSMPAARRRSAFSSRDSPSACGAAGEHRPPDLGAAAGHLGDARPLDAGQRGDDAARVVGDLIEIDADSVRGRAWPSVHKLMQEVIWTAPRLQAFTGLHMASRGFAGFTACGSTSAQHAPRLVPLASHGPASAPPDESRTRRRRQSPMKKATFNYWVDLATGVAFLLCAVTGIVFLLPPAIAAGTSASARPGTSPGDPRCRRGCAPAARLERRGAWPSASAGPPRTTAGRAGSPTHDAAAHVRRPTGPATPRGQRARAPARPSSRGRAGARVTPQAADAARPPRCGGSRTCAPSASVTASSGSPAGGSSPAPARSAGWRSWRAACASSGATPSPRRPPRRRPLRPPAEDRAARAPRPPAAPAAASRPVPAMRRAPAAAPELRQQPERLVFELDACGRRRERRASAAGTACRPAPRACSAGSSSGRASAQNPDACIRCGRCLQVCPAGAITVSACTGEDPGRASRARWGRSSGPARSVLAPVDAVRARRWPA